MKKIILSLLAASCISMSARAYDIESDGLYYNYDAELLSMPLSVSHLSAGNTRSDASIMQRIEAIRQFNKTYPQEKVFLHFDNTGYYMGETMWFKAYVMRSDSASLGSLSRVLYVELVDPAGEVVETKKYKITGGMANGEFLLGRLHHSGFFTVRAYTRYMLNWPDEGIFSRTFPIFNRPEKDGDYSKSVIAADLKGSGSGTTAYSDDYNVRFYPEGGSLVEGLPSKVAFEVFDKKGRALHAKGEISRGAAAVTTVETDSEGRGVFGYTPSGTGRLKLTFDDGKTRSFDLPEAKADGCVMTVDCSDSDIISWTVASRGGVSRSDLAVIFMHRGMMYHHSLDTEHGQIARKDMKEGVNRLLLIDDSGRILASRSVFIYPRHDIRQTDISADSPLIWPGKPVDLTLHTLPAASLSVAVTDAETQTGAYNHNAATWLLLGSELKGYINHPEYYLESDDAAHRKAADLLMMTQGWKNYNLAALPDPDSYKPEYPLEDYLLIDGKLKAYKKRNTVDNVKLAIAMGNRYGDMISGDTITASDGSYVFTLPDCYNDWFLNMKTTKDDKAKKYYIQINRHFSPPTEQASYYETNTDSPIIPDLTFDIDEDHAEGIPMDLKTHWLQEVNVEGQRRWKNPRDAWESEETGARRSSVRYDCQRAADEILDTGEDTPSLIDWLKKKNDNFQGNDIVSGAYRHGTVENNFHGDGPTYNQRPVMWIVDNRFLLCTGASWFGTDANPLVEDYDASNTQFPVFLDDASSVYIAPEGDAWKASGLKAPQLVGRHYVTVFVYTYDRPVEKNAVGIRKTHFSGFNVPEEYERMMDLAGYDAGSADYRRTLYWNPYVTTDSKGDATVEFKNNSTCRNMTVSVGGFTAEGLPVFR